MNIDLDYLRLNVARIPELEFEVVDGLKLIPRGTFAGTIYELGLVCNGYVAASDTGEQGGGQS